MIVCTDRRLTALRSTRTVSFHRRSTAPCYSRTTTSATCPSPSGPWSLPALRHLPLLASDFSAASRQASLRPPYRRHPSMSKIRDAESRTPLVSSSVIGHMHVPPPKSRRLHHVYFPSLFKTFIHNFIQNADPVRNARKTCLPISRDPLSSYTRRESQLCLSFLRHPRFVSFLQHPPHSFPCRRFGNLLYDLDPAAEPLVSAE